MRVDEMGEGQGKEQEVVLKPQMMKERRVRPPIEQISVVQCYRNG